MRKLNVGCGKSPEEGLEWDNLDIRPGPGIDLVMDIQDELLPAPHNTYDFIKMHHVIEHLHDPLKAMENLWFVANDDCTLEILVPHGADDTAWEDQTHLRPYFPGSFAAFGQPYYWKADYGYQGDWEVESIVLEVREVFKDHQDQLDVILERSRNVARNMWVYLRAVKPSRPQLQVPVRRVGMNIKYVP
jgi:SAM-dependent methyltransferase